MAINGIDVDIASFMEYNNCIERSEESFQMSTACL